MTTIHKHKWINFFLLRRLPLINIFIIYATKHNKVLKLNPAEIAFPHEAFGWEAG